MRLSYVSLKMALWCGCEVQSIRTQVVSSHRTPKTSSRLGCLMGANAGIPFPSVFICVHLWLFSLAPLRR